jgi:hypothetical protein
LDQVLGVMRIGSIPRLSPPLLLLFLLPGDLLVPSLMMRFILLLSTPGLLLLLLPARLPPSGLLQLLLFRGLCLRLRLHLLLLLPSRFLLTRRWQKSPILLTQRLLWR